MLLMGKFIFVVFFNRGFARARFIMCKCMIFCFFFLIGLYLKNLKYNFNVVYFFDCVYVIVVLCIFNKNFIVLRFFFFDLFNASVLMLDFF